MTEANLETHGVSFDLAQTVFKDPFAIERLDDRKDYGEERFAIVGMAEGHVVLFVAYTDLIMSARPHTLNDENPINRSGAGSSDPRRTPTSGSPSDE